MLSQITRDSQRVLSNAKRLAKRYNQEIIAPEHLLLGLLQLSGCQAESVLKELRVNLHNLKARLEAHIKLHAKQNEGNIEVGYANRGLKLSVETTTLINEAAAEARENQVDFVDTRLLILGMLRHSENLAAEFLHQYGVTLERFREQAQLKEKPLLNLPKSTSPNLALKTIPLQISPIFILIVLVTVVSGYLTYAGIGNPSRTVFFFVTGGWIISVALHEFGHALVAFLGGDESVVYKGYLTLDPLKYTHPLLSIVLPIVFLIIGGIGLPGGAVYINHLAIKSRTMRSLTSAAGPIVTLLCAAILAVPFYFEWYLGSLDTHAEFWAGLGLLTFLEIVGLFINLLPIPGLDGFGILEPFLPYEVLQKTNLIRPFTFFLLFGLLSWDSPIRTEFWKGLGQVMFWISWDLAWLIGQGFELFRFWAN